jgi:hypothetical protein
MQFWILLKYFILGVAGLAVWYRYSQGFSSLLEYFVFVAIILCLVILDSIVKTRLGYSPLNPDPHPKAFAKFGTPFFKYADSVYRILLGLSLGIIIVTIVILAYYTNNDSVQEDYSSDSTFQEIRLNVYKVKIPHQLKIHKVSSDFYQFEENNEKIGFVKCPMPEKGYEAWDFEVQSRLFKNNNDTYGVDLWVGEAKTEAVDDLSLIFMHKGEFDDWYKDEGHQFSCFIQFDKPLNLEVLEEIYQSIGVL